MISPAGKARSVILLPREVIEVVVTSPILPEDSIPYHVIAVVMNPLLGAIASALLLVGDVNPTTTVVMEVVLDLP